MSNKDREILISEPKDFIDLEPDETFWETYNNIHFYNPYIRHEIYENVYVDIFSKIEGEETKVATVCITFNKNTEYTIDLLIHIGSLKGQYKGEYSLIQSKENLGLPSLDGIRINGQSFEEYITLMVFFLFNAEINKNMRNPERYEVLISHDKEPLQEVRHRGCFAYDGCHKIYIMENIEDVMLFTALGYDIYPIEKLKETWKNSCSLRFIHNGNLKKTYIPQFASYVKILGHKRK